MLHTTLYETDTIQELAGLGRSGRSSLAAPKRGGDNFDLNLLLYHVKHLHVFAILFFLTASRLLYF